MEPISFEKITNEIIEILSINSIDAYYRKNHPYFLEDKLQVNKLFEKLSSKLKLGYSVSAFSEKQIKDMCLSIPNYKEANLQKIQRAFKDLNEQFYSTPEELSTTLVEKFAIPKETIPTKPEGINWEVNIFKFWVEHNLGLIQDYVVSERNNIITTEQKKVIKSVKSSFDLKKEEEFLDEIKIVFPFLQIEIRDNNLMNKTIQDTAIFHKALKPNFSVPFDRINNSIKEILNGKLPSKTHNFYLGTYKYQLTPIEVSNDDDLVGIIFALKKCFKKQNIIRTDNNIYYLDFGNGIVGKFHIRENKENLPSDIALLSNEDGSIYKNTILFSGYASSGYRLNKGLYIISSDLIFEMYFDASPFLISNSDIQSISQNICDSKIRTDEEQERYNVLYDDDDEW